LTKRYDVDRIKSFPRKSISLMVKECGSATNSGQSKRRRRFEKGGQSSKLLESCRGHSLE
jgi:hypothetical protein